MHTRAQGEGAVTSQETEPDLLASVRGFCYQKLGVSITGPESNPGDRVLDEVEKDNFSALPAREASTMSQPQRI